MSSHTKLMSPARHTFRGSHTSVVKLLQKEPAHDQLLIPPTPGSVRLRRTSIQLSMLGGGTLRIMGKHASIIVASAICSACSFCMCIRVSSHYHSQSITTRIIACFSSASRLRSVHLSINFASPNAQSFTTYATTIRLSGCCSCGA